MSFSHDVLLQYQHQLLWAELEPQRRELFDALQRSHWDDVRSLVAGLPELANLTLDFSKDAITVGKAADLNAEQHALLQQLISKLIPWRKGPFELFGQAIDAEWKSNLKWDRVCGELGGIKGRRVADIGCGNGYYMFRMLPLEPECVVGFDPSEKFFFVYQLLQHFIRAKNLQFELLGLEHAALFPEFFDVILCMGVLYHQRNPLEALNTLRGALATNGKLILETLIIPGTEPTALFPFDRYAKMRNVYFLPTTTTLINWLTRSGFGDISIISESVTTLEEQRKTQFSTGESLEDFLDPSDTSKTVEGYPAPRRVIVTARPRV